MELGASPLIYLVPLARVERAAHGLGNKKQRKAGGNITTRFSF